MMKRRGRYRDRVLRKSITLRDKLKVLQMIDAGKRQVEVSKTFNLAGSTIRTIVKNRDKIIKCSRMATSMDAMKLNRVRPHIMLNMEKLLEEHITKQAEQGVTLNSSAIKKKAVDIYKELSVSMPKDVKIERFCASKGWLGKFLKRIDRVAMDDNDELAVNLFYGEDTDGVDDEVVEIKHEILSDNISDRLNEEEDLNNDASVRNSTQSRDDETNDLSNSFKNQVYNLINDEIKVKTEFQSDSDEHGEKQTKKTLEFKDQSDRLKVDTNQGCNRCNEESENDAFAKFIGDGLSRITDESLYKITKWNLQIVLMQGLQKQLKIDKPKKVRHNKK